MTTFFACASTQLPPMKTFYDWRTTKCHLRSTKEELSVKRQILAFLKGFCEKANFGQNSAKICLCSQNLPFHRIIETCLKTGIFVPSGTPSTFLDESHCNGTEELIQKNNWSHKKFSYFITERVKDSSF